MALKSSVMPAGPGGNGTTPAIIWNSTTPRGVSNAPLANEHHVTSLSQSGSTCYVRVSVRVRWSATCLFVADYLDLTVPDRGDSHRQLQIQATRRRSSGPKAQISAITPCGSFSKISGGIASRVPQNVIRRAVNLRNQTVVPAHLGWQNP